jgi:hypothetical protein
MVIVVLSLLIFSMFMGCSNKNTSKDTFNIEQFQNKMKSKNYKFETQDVGEDFLPTTRKRMIMGDEALDIYIFANNKKMENAARCIDSDGSGYSNGFKSVKVSWIAPPHFYKRGSIIVQYVGEKENIISDLKDILGEQFAGIK